MKFACHCGATISDAADSQSNKAQFIPDQEWLSLLETIDGAIEKSGSSPGQKEAACMRVRKLMGELSRPAWQCYECGRVYLSDHQHELHGFSSEEAEATQGLFHAARPS